MSKPCTDYCRRGGEAVGAIGYRGHDCNLDPANNTPDPWWWRI